MRLRGEPSPGASSILAPTTKNNSDAQYRAAQPARSAKLDQYGIILCVVPLRKENRVATRLLQQLVKTNTEGFSPSKLRGVRVV